MSNWQSAESGTASRMSTMGGTIRAWFPLRLRVSDAAIGANFSMQAPGPARSRCCIWGEHCLLFTTGREFLPHHR